MVQCFGVMPNKIHNRSMLDGERPSTRDSDSADDVNLFLNFKLTTTVSKWTVVDSCFPNRMEERGFECWKCKTRKKYFWFTHAQAFHLEDDIGFPTTTTFFGLLGSFEYGRFPCCDTCYHALAFRCGETPGAPNACVPECRG